MCSNYGPTKFNERLRFYFDVDRGGLGDFAPGDVWPLQPAPFITRGESGARELHQGAFGLLPHWAKKLADGRRAYNSRTETVASKPTFREAWQRGRRCIVPADYIYEPNYETGKPVRWRIQKSGNEPMGIAGIWERPWQVPGGPSIESFSMLTVSGAGHTVFQRLHAPEDEKRMVVILAPVDYDAWLTCSAAEAPTFFRQWIGPLYAGPAPLPPRAPRSSGAS